MAYRYEISRKWLLFDKRWGILLNTRIRSETIQELPAARRLQELQDNRSVITISINGSGL